LESVHALQRSVRTEVDGAHARMLPEPAAEDARIPPHEG
jgi:hypothetical protein